MVVAALMIKALKRSKCSAARAPGERWGRFFREKLNEAD